jgi:hypothetical protein
MAILICFTMKKEVRRFGKSRRANQPRISPINTDYFQSVKIRAIRVQPGQSTLAK